MEQTTLNKINNKLSYLIAEIERRKEFSYLTKDLEELEIEVKNLHSKKNSNENIINELSKELNTTILKSLSENDLLEFLITFEENEESLKILKNNKEAVKAILESYKITNINIETALEKV